MSNEFGHADMQPVQKRERAEKQLYLKIDCVAAEKKWHLKTHWNRRTKDMSDLTNLGHKFY